MVQTANKHDNIDPVLKPQHNSIRTLEAKTTRRSQYPRDNKKEIW
jgi:hypothetical protein